MPLSYTQKQALKIVPRITAALSVLGSGSIVVSVVRKMHNSSEGCVASCIGGSSTATTRRSSIRGGRQQQAVLGQALLLGMSLLDFFSSWSYVIGDVAFPEPKGEGTQTSCNFQAFLCNLQVGAAIYSGFLAWYYCLFIRYPGKWTHARLRSSLEPWAHLVSCAFPLATAITAIAKELYNPHWIRCYIAGPGSNVYFWGFFFAPIWASMLFGTVAMILIFCSVRQTEAKSLQHTFSTQSNSNFKGSNSNFDSSRFSLNSYGKFSSSLRSLSDGDNSGELGGTAKPRVSLADLPKSRRVAYQGLWYTGAFLLCYIFPTTSRIWANVSDVPAPYPIKILATSMVGTQGLLNWFVYFIQPKLHGWFEARRIRRERENRKRQQARTLSSKDSQLLQSPFAGEDVEDLDGSIHLVQEVGEIEQGDPHLDGSIHFEEGKQEELADDDAMLEQLDDPVKLEGGEEKVETNLTNVVGSSEDEGEDTPKELEQGNSDLGSSIHSEKVKQEEVIEEDAKLEVEQVGDSGPIQPKEKPNILEADNSDVVLGEGNAATAEDLEGKEMTC